MCTPSPCKKRRRVNDVPTPIDATGMATIATMTGGEKRHRIDFNDEGLGGGTTIGTAGPPISMMTGGLGGGGGDAASATLTPLKTPSTPSGKAKPLDVNGCKEIAEIFDKYLSKTSANSLQPSTLKTSGYAY